MTFKEDLANKAPSKGKSRPLCFHCEKFGYFKVECFKWLATNRGKKYTKNHPADNKDDSANQVSNNKNKLKDSQNRSRSKKPMKKKSGSACAAQEDSRDDSYNAWMTQKIKNNFSMTWIIDSDAS